MTMDEFIQEYNGKTLDDSAMVSYIKGCGGIKKIKQIDLEKLLYARSNVLVSKSYLNLYKIVSDNESGRLIKVWTWIAGTAAVISAITSIIVLLG